MTEYVTHEEQVRLASPPWLQRTAGWRYMRSLGQAIDSLVTRAVEGVAHRFPGVVDNSSLAMIGRERRIRRGPGESAATYAARLLGWWDAPRIRGGPYALLRQLYAFTRYWLNVRMDVVYHSGTRRWIDTDGEITRDAITWSVSPDGTDDWSQVWVVYWVPSEIPLEGDELVTTWNELITTIDGDPIVTGYTVHPSALTTAEAEVFKMIPREWSAAHIKRTHVVLLWGAGELWDYHSPDGSQDGTWGEWEDPTTTFDEDAPTVLVIEE